MMWQFDTLLFEIVLSNMFLILLSAPIGLDYNLQYFLFCGIF